MVKTVKSLLFALCVAIAVGLAVNGLGRLAYARGWIDVDVSDRQGHGPDRGAEYDGAARWHIKRFAVYCGIVSFPAAAVIARLKMGRPR